MTAVLRFASVICWSFAVVIAFQRSSQLTSAAALEASEELETLQSASELTVDDQEADKTKPDDDDDDDAETQKNSKHLYDAKDESENPDLLVKPLDELKFNRSSAETAVLRRSKRAVIGQCQMMDRQLQGTGKGCLDFNNYGNWCGRGGSGPCVDDIDDCCYTHDRCWDAVKAANRHNCLGSMYLFNWDNPSNPCDTARANIAQRRCCNCDWQFANCIARYTRQGRYNSSYKLAYGRWGRRFTGSRTCYLEWSF